MRGPDIVTEKEDAYIREHFTEGNVTEMCRVIGWSEMKLRAYARRQGLKRDRYPEWKIEKLKELFPNHKNTEIAETLGWTENMIVRLGRKFKLKKTKEFIYSCASKTMFKKGLIPYNKGKKMADYCSAESIAAIRRTQFKKGGVPPNTREVGSERIDKDGYVMIKPPVGKFRNKHTMIWEQYHGKVPKGYCVSFKDGNKQNVTIENLELISREELMRRNSLYRYPEDIQRTIRTIGVLHRRIHKIERDGKSRNSK